MILEKKTALLSPRGTHGVSGVARFECFKEKSDVKISLNGHVRDTFAVVAVGDELRIVRPCADRVYLARTDLSGDCAVIVADGEKRVLCAGATKCGYDFARLEEFLMSAYCDTAEENGNGEKDEKEKDAHPEVKEETVADSKEREETSDEAKVEEGGEEAAVGDGSAKSETMTEESAPVQAAEKDDRPADVVGSVADADDIGAGESGKRPRKEKKKVRFYDRIADKIAKLLGENEREDELCALIPDSNWVRVKADDGAYVVGVVGDPVEFICYGIPADNALDPPDEKQGCRQWLEVVRGGRGYWMMYQSAETGETLTADVI